MTLPRYNHPSSVMTLARYHPGSTLRISDEANPGAATDIVINTTANLPADQLKPKRQKAVLMSTAPKTRRQQSTRPAAVEKSVSANVKLLSTASSLSADPVSPSIEHQSTMGLYCQ